MKRVKYIVFLFIVLFVSGMSIQAQDLEIYEGMTWYLKKSVALDSARSQGKQVFLVWGTTSCNLTINARKRVAKNELKAIVDEHYILWFADAVKYNRGSEEVSDYLLKLTGTVTFPAVCIIDLYNTKVAYGLSTGAQSEADLLAMLNRYVNNDCIVENSEGVVGVHVSGSRLVVKSVNLNEMIRVYSLTGTLIDKFKKTDQEIIRNIFGYPKGVVIIASSSGWTRKAVIL